jgi:hypothetical protein
VGRAIPYAVWARAVPGAILRAKLTGNLIAQNRERRVAEQGITQPRSGIKSDAAGQVLGGNRAG